MSGWSQVGDLRGERVDLELPTLCQLELVVIRVNQDHKSLNVPGLKRLEKNIMVIGVDIVVLGLVLISQKVPGDQELFVLFIILLVIKRKR